MQSLLTPKSNSSELTKEVLLTQVFSYSDCTNFLLSPQEIDVTRFLQVQKKPESLLAPVKSKKILLLFGLSLKLIYSGL